MIACDAAYANIRGLQQMLGHKAATLTVDLYGHLSVDDLDAVADVMEVARTAAGELRAA